MVGQCRGAAVSSDLSVATTRRAVSTSRGMDSILAARGDFPEMAKRFRKSSSSIGVGNSPYRASASTALFAFGTALAANAGMFIPSTRTVCTSTMPMKPRI